jgi:Zn-dependent protease with chaperone function
MNHADLQHLARLSELACEANAQAYRRSVKWFALLGYLWVLLCLAVGVALLGWLALTLVQGGKFRGFMIGGFLLGTGLLTAGVSALWLRLEPPTGQPLSPEQAPELFKLLRKIGKKIGGPPIHHVLVDDDFNAFIVQIPRWGLIGGANTNYLVLGLPMLMAIEPARLASVLAHEYGHLREGHGSFSAWIYRSRMAWQRFYERLDDQQNLASAVNSRFIRWYFPRFIAKSFALARQDEYAADRVACRLMKPEVTAAALKEIVVKGDWLHNEFWDAHWRLARTHPVAQGPMASMQRALQLQPEPSFAQRSLQRAWQQASTIEDTHPGLRDRLEALDPERQADRRAPVWSRQSALALLGPALPSLMQHLDKQWCSANAGAWKEYHADMQRWAQRIEQLRAGAARNQAADWTELGDLMLRLDPQADAAAMYERALALSSQWPEALLGLARLSAKTAPAQSLAWAQRLHENSPQFRHWAARHAVALLENSDAPDAKELATWRQRLKDAEQAEERVWDELTSSEWHAQLERHDLSEFERGECTAFLQRQKPIQQAWIARKLSREFPWRRCYVLVVELTRMSEDETRDYMHWLMQQFPTPGPCLVGCAQLGMDPKQAPRGVLSPLCPSTASGGASAGQ